MGVDGAYGVLAVGALRWRVVVRCAGSHFCRNSVSPTCIASNLRSCSSSRARPSLLRLNISELAFSEANCTSHRHLCICSNLASHPLIMTSMSFDVIGVGGVVSTGWRSSSLKMTSWSSSPFLVGGLHLFHVIFHEYLYNNYSECLIFFFLRSQISSFF